MGRSSKTVISTLLVALAVVLGVGLLVLFTGAYNVAATQEHWAVTRWALNTLQERSVGTRAEALPVPLPTDPAPLDHGFEHFHEMCVLCHGAPGMDRGEPGQGMRPVPPRLSEEAEEWSDAELFWITKHGIRLGGMPAFGPTHSDEEIAGIVAFLRQLQDMTETEYAERVRAAEGGASGESGESGESEHTHAPGTEPHED